MLMLKDTLIYFAFFFWKVLREILSNHMNIEYVSVITL